MEEALKEDIWRNWSEIYDIKLISLKESVFSNTFHEGNILYLLLYMQTDSYDVALNDEAEEYDA